MNEFSIRDRVELRWLPKKKKGEQAVAVNIFKDE